MKKKIVSLLVTLSMLLGLLPATAMATGNQTNDQDDISYYEVDTVEELRYALLTESVEEIKLTGDIDMGGATWAPVNITRNLVIDGDDHVISDFKVTKSFYTGDGVSEGNASDYYYGFISSNQATLTIKDLSFDEAVIDPVVAEGTIGSSMVAVVVGKNSGTLYMNNVTVTNSEVSGFQKVGVLLGYTDANTATLTKCTVEDCSVLLEKDGSSSYAAFAGVLVGYNGSGNRTVVNGVAMSGNTIAVDDSVDWNGPEIQKDADGGYWLYYESWGNVGLISPTYTRGSYAYDSVVFTAEVGGYQYETLAEAVEAAKPGDTVELLKSVTISETLDITKDLTIDGKGNTLTYTGSGYSNPAINASAAAVDLTLEDLTIAFTTTSFCERGVNFNNPGSLTMDKVNIKSEVVSYIVNFPSSSANAVVNISNSTLTGRFALNIWGSNMTISVTDSALTSVGSDKTVESYAAVALNNNGTNVASGTKVTINGGSISATYKTGEPAPAIRNNVGEAATVIVSETTDVNGTASSDKTVAMVTYSADPGASFYGYATLQDALAKAEKDGSLVYKVVLIENIQLTKTLTIPSSVLPKLNLGECTITAADGYELTVSEDGTTYTVTPIPVTSVTLDKATLSLKVGNTGTLTATVAPADAADKTVTWTSGNESVAAVDANGVVTAKAAGTAVITAKAGDKTATCTVTVTRVVSSNSDSSSSGSTTPSNPTVDKETTKNDDGSTTVTETKKDGTTVETTTNTDGSTVTTETKTEVKETATSTTTTTTTETVSKDAEGNKETVKVEEKVVETATSTTTTTTTETKTDTKTETTKTVEEVTVDEEGNETVTTTATTETKLDNGSTGTTTVAADGTTTAEVKLTGAAINDAAKTEEAVTLPMPEVAATTTSETAPVVEIDMPNGKSNVTVEIPVADVSAGTVAVIVHADGTEEIVKTSTITENGVVLTVDGDATVKIVDNSKDFTDVPETYTLSDSIDFVSARGLFEGNTETTFNPHANTTIAQTMTVLARLEGEDFYGVGSTAKGSEWASEKGLHDGSDVYQPITREQMVVMMWKLAGSPESDHEIDHHADDHLISDHALEAMQWAVEMGIIQGNLDGSLNPHGYASRAHVAAFAERYVNAI